MTVDALIDQHVEVLSLDMTGDQALEVMNACYSPALPLVNAEGKLHAIVTEEFLLSKDVELSLAAMQIPEVFPALNQRNHFVDAIRILGQTKLPIVPVVDDVLMYQGSVSTTSIMEFLYNSGSIDDRGTTIMVEMNPRDYTMTEISRLIESEQAKILSSFVYSDQHSELLQLSLKLNVMDASHIVATLERFGYRVFDFSLTTEQQIDQLKDRIDSFLAYLQIWYFLL